MQKVVSGSMYYIRTRYNHELRSPNWRAIRIKEWSDGKFTYVFEWCGKD